ncbi:hypothetical protein [Altererythrobacter litoralis]|uniref:Uncharacterized protein n=1 Tax=Altererythrobacter litoralis TaxID=3113904 RepID=A0ABU7GD04_9SPHN|nr:hypothetical protein [Erythrobacteraceae bacterium 1XM1-14]
MALHSTISAYLRIVLVAFALLSPQFLLTAPAQAVHTSLICTERTATVAIGGSGNENGFEVSLTQEF